MNTSEPRYRRIVLKISGESLGAETGASLDASRFHSVAADIAEAGSMGVSVAVVVGGGNHFRGPDGYIFGLDETDADSVGMIGTGLNAMLLAGACRKAGVGAEVLSRGPCSGIGRPWERRLACSTLDSGKVVILAGGMGISGMSTDVPAVHTAVQVDAEAVVMAKHGVDAIFDADPRDHPAAMRLDRVTASIALRDQLAVMDMTALQLALEWSKPIHVIGAADKGALRRLLRGEAVGSEIAPI